MKVSTWIWFAIFAFTLYLVFFATLGNDGTLLIGCSNVVQTRGGTICLDRAYLR